MQYRRATINDIETLVAFRKKAQIESGSAGIGNIDSELREYFRLSLLNTSFISWAAVENDKVVSSCGMCFYQLLPSYANPTGKIAYITTVYTLMEHRKKGLATQLLARVIDEAKILGYSVVRLHSSAAGKPLYEKIGFSCIEGYMELRL